MKKCKKKDGLIYDYEKVEIKKVDYRIYLSDDFVCTMNEDEFKENFEILEEDTENTNTSSYSTILKKFVNSEYDGERSFWDRAGAKRELTEVLLLLGRYKLTHLTEEFCKSILDKYKVPYEDNTTTNKEEEVSYVVKPVDWYKTIGIDYTDKNFKEKVYSMIPSDVSEKDYKEDLKDVKNLIREIRKKTIIDIIKYKEMEIKRNQDFLLKGLKIPIARPVSHFFNDEIIRLRQEIEALKSTLEGLEKNDEKM